MNRAAILAIVASVLIICVTITAILVNLWAAGILAIVGLIALTGVAEETK